MSALVADLWNVTRKCIQRELRSLDVNIKLIFFRMIWKSYVYVQELNQNI